MYHCIVDGIYQENTKGRETVLFLITKATFGGAQRYVYDLARKIRQYGYTPVVAFGVPGRLSELLASDGIHALAIPALRRDISIISDLRCFFEIRACIRDVLPAVLHLNSSKAAGIGALAGRLEGVPRIVFTVHGWPFREPRSAFSRFLMYMASFITALLAHRVITITHDDFELGKRMWWVRKKISLVPIGREPLEFLTPDEGFRALFASPPPLSGHTIRIVSISELNKNKGLKFAIEAIGELKRRGVDAIYVNAGDGEERAALESRIESLGISDRVFLPPFVEDAARALRGFDVFILPSQKEGMPYVMIEAVLAGIPIVASDIVRKDFPQSPHIAYIPPGNSLALADAIQEIARKPRANGPEDAFPLEAMVKDTIETYR